MVRQIAHTHTALARPAPVAVVGALANTAVIPEPVLSIAEALSTLADSVIVAWGLTRTSWLPRLVNDDNNFLLAELALPAALALDTETVFAAAMAVTVGLARDPGLDGLTAVHPIPSVVTDALATLAPSVLAAVAWARHRVRTVHTSETLLAETDAGGSSEELALTASVTVVGTLDIRTSLTLPSLLARALSDGVVADSVARAVEGTVLEGAVIGEVALATDAAAAVTNTIVVTVVVAVARRVVARLSSGALNILVGTTVLRTI